MTRFIILGFASMALCSIETKAQAHYDPYGSYTPGSYNNYVREKNIQSSNAKSLEQSMQRNTSSSSSYSSSTMTSAERAAYNEQMGAQLMRAFKGPSAEEIKANQELSRQMAAQAAQVAASKADLEARRQRYCEEQESKYIQMQKSNYRGPLGAADQREMNKDGFFAVWIESETEKYAKADAALAQYELEKGNGDFTRLLSLADLSATHPYAASACYADLYKRFPGKQRDIEVAELYALPFYFGARRRMLYPSVSRAYPESVYEDASSQEQHRILEKFKSLADKYPNDALRATGACRPHINPYLIMAKAQEKNIPEATKMYLLYLRSDGSGNAQPKYDGKDHTAWEDWADRRVGPAAKWLTRYAEPAVKSLSSQDWLDISKAQNMRVDLIAWAFRDEDADPEDEDKPRYWKRYPALAKARKMDK